MSASRAQQVPPSALWAAASNGDEAAVRELLKQPGVDLEAGERTDSGTAVWAASQSNHSHIVELLLQAGANINAQNSDGWTLLHLAAAVGRATVVHSLIITGADVNARADGGATPLLFAAQSGHLFASQSETLEVVQMLIDAGSDIRATTNNGTTVLHMAALLSKDPGLIPCLLAAGAGCHLNWKAFMDGRLVTPLMMACMCSNTTAVECLLQAGADVGARMEQGLTALHEASLLNREDIVELLIAAGADVEAVTDDGHTPSSAQ